MKLLSQLCLAALVAATTGSALADTINLESYGNTNSAVAAGANNSALSYLGYESSLSNGLLVGSSSNTYNVGTGNVWHAPTGTSSWVSNSAQAYPGGSVTPANGVYVYSTTFTDLNPLSSTGSLEIMADDTAIVYLNGTMITPGASTATTGTCDSGTPNCTTPTTYNLSGFVSGTNTLYFGVLQEHGSAEGLDFSGSVTSTAVTPEPNSLLLLATGLLAGGVLLYRRRLGATLGA